MKKTRIIQCEKCKKDYYYESDENICGSGKDWETAYCPYCNAEGPSEFISGFIRTFKIDGNGNPIR